METRFAEMKRFVRFTSDDSRNLSALHPIARPHLPWLAGQFYERILQHPEASAVFSGPEQVERLKVSLMQWGDRLLSGPHDEEYYELRCRIGRTHVRVGLQQMYMFTGMNVIRECLRDVVFREMGEDPQLRDRVVVSLHKILDLELAIMLETYREDYVAKLQQSEQQSALKRLAAIGEVATMIAHEVRNPLAGISGAVEIIRDDLGPDNPRREILREVLSQVRRLDNRVRDLLLYARKVKLLVEPTDPAELISSTLALLSAEPMLRGVRTRVSLEGTLGPHPMDRGQMLEVLVNLIRNAADAMKGSGELVIEARRLATGGLMLAVEDTGPGVPADKLEEIFIPFVTTRPEGTGLGLSIARKTLEAHGGSLRCEPCPRGARFVLLLPPAVTRAGSAAAS